MSLRSRSKRDVTLETQKQSLIPRFGFAALFSLGINAGLVFGLSGLNASTSTAEPEMTPQVPISVIETPPPPKPTKTVEDSDSIDMSDNVAQLPPLELPSQSNNLGGVEVPKTDLSKFGWNLQMQLPSFSGRGSGVLGDKVGADSNPPILLYQPDLATYYPSRARRSGITGATKLLLDIDSLGRVSNIEIVKSVPSGVFERAARRAAKRLKYKPSSRNGRPQAAKVSMEFIWKLD